MLEKKIINNLKSLKPKPDKEWQIAFNNYIQNLNDDVTYTENSRTSILNVFNFLNKTVMNVRLTVGAIIGTAVVMIGGGVATVYASDSSKPGDFLFPVDSAVEGIQRSLISDPTAKAQFEMAVMTERVNELEALSEGTNESATALAIGEVNAEQIRLQEKLQEMDGLRLQEKLQTQEQLKLLEQLKTQTRINEAIMNKVQQKLQDNGDTSNKNSLSEVQTQYSNQVKNTISDFEQETGLTVQEAEQNAGTDSQIQNQNQIQNGTTTPSGTGSSNGNGQPTVTPKAQQGKD